MRVVVVFRTRMAQLKQQPQQAEFVVVVDDDDDLPFVEAAVVVVVVFVVVSDSMLSMWMQLFLLCSDVRVCFVAERPEAGPNHFLKRSYSLTNLMSELLSAELES